MSLYELALDLASVEAEVKAQSADIKQTRAKQQQSALSVVEYLWHTPPIDHTTGSRVDDNVVRQDMLAAGVLKGTVSKIMTVVKGLRNGAIGSSHLTSLSGAYGAVKDAEKKILAEALEDLESPPAPPPARTTTPDEAMNIILKSIREAGDEDAVYKAAGEWITKITQEITKVTESVHQDNEE